MKKLYRIIREDMNTGVTVQLYASSSRDNALSWLRYFRDTNKYINYRFYLEG